MSPVGLVTVQMFLLNILDKLEMPYGIAPADAYITPPDPRMKAKVPAIYIWPGEGNENRSRELGGTVPRNTGPGTPSGTKGQMHMMDVYITWFTAGPKLGTDVKQLDPKFPGIVDAVMFALRTSQPNPVTMTDPNNGLVSDIYNVGEVMMYRTGIESVADEREKRYDCLVRVDAWEIFRS